MRIPRLAQEAGWKPAARATGFIRFCVPAGRFSTPRLSSYALDTYLRDKGRLGFVITQSVFKTEGGGRGFRSFRLGSGVPVQVIHVDDMVGIQPFEGATNRTSVIILEKGKETRYPLKSYLVWKKSSGPSLSYDFSLDDVLASTLRQSLTASPVNPRDPTSPWITGRPHVIAGLRKVIGQADYKARIGSNTFLNGVYWLNVVGESAGRLMVRNIGEGGKKHVLNYLKIPAYSSKNPTHSRLSSLSQRAHALAAVIHDENASEAAREKARARLAEVETEIDERAAELWGLTEKELKEMQRSLEELG